MTINSNDLAIHLPALWKYYPLRDDREMGFIIDVLENKNLWFSDPLKFNDPFDSVPRIHGTATPEERYQYFLKLSRAENTGYSSRVHKSWASKKSKKFVLPDIKQVLKNWSICCFSSMELSPLLWAHYAVKYQGICIGFDTKALTIGGAIKVYYVVQRPALNMFRIEDDDVMKSFTRKAVEWEYEHEYRLIERKMAGKKYIGDMKVNEVVIGHRVDDYYIEKLNKICATKNIDIKHLKISPSEFKIEK